MTILRVLTARVRALHAKRRREAELSDEIREHLDLLTDDYLDRGLSLDEARAAARREFGGIEQVKEAYREQRGLPLVDATMQDLRYALRTFRRSPGFVAAVILSLSLGIGANTAIFTVLKALMLESLPVRNAEELFVAKPRGPGDVPDQFSYPVFEQLRRAAPTPNSLAAMSLIARMYRALDDRRETQLIAVQLVSGEFFPMLGLSAVRGRVLAPEDNQQVGGHSVAVISHGLAARPTSSAARSPSTARISRLSASARGSFQGYGSSRRRTPGFR